MKTKGFLGKFALCAAVLFTVAVVNAGFWDWSRPYQGPSKDIKTLIFTGNFTKSRLLAELIQRETKQPILLLPAKEGGQFFGIPSKGPAMEVKESDFTGFINFLNPKQIIILGDCSYVPEAYIKKIDSRQTIIKIDNKNWNEIAVTAGKILDKTNLAHDFKKLSNEIDGGKLYKSGGESESVAPAPAPISSDIGSALKPEPLNPTVKTAGEEPVLIKDTDVVPK